MNFDELEGIHLGPLRPDLVYTSDDELSDDGLEDEFIADELDAYDHNVMSAEEEVSLFQNTVPLSAGLIFLIIFCFKLSLFKI